MKQKFNLDDRVMSKRTGLPQVGIIIGLNKANYFEETLTKLSQWNARVWDRLYPNWRLKPLYGVELDKPSKPFTYEEFKEVYPNMSKEDWAECPDVDIWVFPEEDLEVI